MTVVEQAEKRQRASSEFASADLARAPRVNELLRETGLGEFLSETVSSPPGRNEIWIGATTEAEKVFVKRLLGPPSDVQARMGRLLAFQRFAEGLTTGADLVPLMLAHDREAGIVVYEGVASALGGAQLMVDEEFTIDLAVRTGRAIGTIHAAVPEEDAGVDTSLPGFPSPALLNALPMRMFDNLSLGELQAWGLMQSDPRLVEAVHRLLEREVDAPKHPAHCDFRVDQLLIASDAVLITDWEEFRLADPARDVGGFAGEWLYRSVLDIVTTRNGLAPVEVDLEHEDIIRRGAESLTRLRPYVSGFWKGYLEVRGPVDEGLRARATAFAGWHLLDRLLASSSRRARLTGIERAAAGIGRSALLSPDRFADVIGIEETP